MSAPPGEVSYYTADQVEALLDARIAALAEGHNQAMQSLAASMRGQVQTYIPEHAGGEGTGIADTWSQAEQAAAWRRVNQ